MLNLSNTRDVKLFQDAPPWPGRLQSPQVASGRFLGCLLGGAVGDALGASVEFMRRSQILRQFGPNGLTGYALHHAGIGTITDDTQMTLFTAEGLLRAWLKHLVTKQDLAIDDLCEIMALAYLRWLRTQGQYSKAWPDDGDETLGWLYQQEKLHSRRAPGSTCLSSLREMANLGQLATNDSKGCGGVMRMAPVGLFCWRLRHQWTMGHAFYFGANFSALTHGHPSGNLPAGVLAILIAALADGVSMPEALDLSKNILKIAPEHEETLNALEMAEDLAASARPPHEAIAALGEGWVAEEALAISVYCALVAKTFRQGVLLAVNHDGDSDSTGAITGNLLGARLGLKAIPKAWLKPLELREVITAIADDLFDCGNWPTGQPEMSGDEIGRIQALKEKYPV